MIAMTTSNSTSVKPRDESLRPTSVGGETLAGGFKDRITGIGFGRVAEPKRTGNAGVGAVDSD